MIPKKKTIKDILVVVRLWKIGLSTKWRTILIFDGTTLKSMNIIGAKEAEIW